MIGTCESGPVPTPYRTGRGGEVPPDFGDKMDKGNSHSLFAYGTISLDYSNKTGAVISLRTLKTGDYKVVVTTTGGDVIKQIVYEQLAENSTVLKPASDLPKGKYYVQLYFGDLLVHYQELIIR